ncbi:hypothetical protein [Mesorhizobium sp. 128a]
MILKNPFANLEPDQIDVEVMSAFHLGGRYFSVSVQLSDENDEIGHSYLLKVLFDGKTLRYETLLEVPNLILAHVSPTPIDHVALEIGGTTHFLHGTAHAASGTPDQFFNKLYHQEGGAVYLYGEHGAVCVAEGHAWRAIKPIAKSFLRAMHGPRNGPVHVAGDDGTLLRLAGNGWKRIPLNFNRSINALQVAEDGVVNIGCEDGYCFQYFEDDLVAIEAPERDFFSICEFKGKRYWGDDEYGLYVQKRLKLAPLKELGYGYAMQASSEFLVVVGWKEVFLFDGSTWVGFEFGYNKGLHASIIDMSRRFL